MRHFFYVNSDGELVGPSTCHGGFSEDLDLTDPGCAHPLALGILKQAATLPSFDRFIEYVCGCPGTEAACACPFDRLIDSYADGMTLVTKPALQVSLDGVTYAPTAGKAERTAGTPVPFKLVGDITDGHQVTVTPVGSASVLAEAVVLTFNGGETEGINLVTPATGMTGRVVGHSKYVRQFWAQLKGV